jgi:polysaccharide biosynthesis transport protein
MTDAANQEAGGSALPFDPITLLIGLFRRWKVFVAIVLFSFVMGAVLSFFLGTKVFEADSLLLYKGVQVKDSPESLYGLSLPLNTQINMIKTSLNFEQVREKLKLGTDIKNLGRAVRVEVQKQTALVTISAQWNSSQMVAAIVNTLRDVFLTNQMRLAKENAKRQLDDLESRFKTVHDGLKEADSKLQTFIIENKIVDLSKQIQWNLEQVTSLQLLLSNASVDRETVEAQKSVLQERIDLLARKVAEESSQSKNDQSLADLNIKIERLRRAIHDNQVQRENDVELSKYKLIYERAQKLYEKGLISRAELEEAKASLEAQTVKTVDTEQITEWKRQLKVLEAEVIPPKEEFKSPSQQFMQDLQLKILDMELQSMSLQQKIAYLSKEIDRVREKLDVLTELQRQHAALTREVTAREAEKKDLEKQLAMVRQVYEANASDFLVLADAKPPVFSIKSNKKIIFAVVVVLGFMAAGTLILALELMDTTIKSAAELSQKFALPVVAVIPKFKTPQELYPDADHFPLIEMFRIVSRHIRHDFPQRGARILITSADRWEGKTAVTANLAACLGRQDERVLMMDAQLRSIEGQRDLRYLIAERDKPLVGLADYLTFGADSIEEIAWPTVLPGVECIPRMEQEAVPDLLASIRMQELLKELSERFSLVLIDGPPMADYVDAELVAQWCDAVILVVRSRTCRSSQVKGAVERLKEADIRNIRFVINDVDKLYLSRA